MYEKLRADKASNVDLIKFIDVESIQIHALQNFLIS